MQRFLSEGGITRLSGNMQVKYEEFYDLKEAIDNVWTTNCAYGIILMKFGFAFLEAGSIRYKNMISIFIKTFGDFCMTAFAFWLFGYAFAFGEDHNGFIGTTFFASKGILGAYVNESLRHTVHWLFQFGVAQVCTTIISGCIAERMDIMGYLKLSFFHCAWTYPVQAHWIWGNGFLMKMGFIDFAGSTGVHLCGGLAGLVSSIQLGNRLKRFDPLHENNFKPSNLGYCVMSCIQLWFSWYAFNAGTTLGSTNQRSETIGIIGINCTLAGASSALFLFYYHYFQHRNTSSRYSLLALSNGCLTGLVAITANCNNVDPWCAVAIGVISALFYKAGAYILHQQKIDDVVDAYPIHFANGIWGTITPGFFDKTKGIFYGDNGNQLGIQIAGLLAIFAWVLVNTYVFNKILQWCGMFRISEKEEEMGLDLAFCGGNEGLFFDVNPFYKGQVSSWLKVEPHQLHDDNESHRFDSHDHNDHDHHDHDHHDVQSNLVQPKSILGQISEQQVDVQSNLVQPKSKFGQISEQQVKIELPNLQKQM